MAPITLLVVAPDKDIHDFIDALDACKATGPIKILTATKAVEAAGLLTVS